MKYPCSSPKKIIKMGIILYGSQLTIFGVHAKYGDGLVNKKDVFFEQLHREISSIGRVREIDLNIRI